MRLTLIDSDLSVGASTVSVGCEFRTAPSVYKAHGRRPKVQTGTTQSSGTIEKTIPETSPQIKTAPPRGGCGGIFQIKPKG